MGLRHICGAQTHVQARHPYTFLFKKKLVYWATWMLDPALATMCVYVMLPKASNLPFLGPQN